MLYISHPHYTTVAHMYMYIHACTYMHTYIHTYIHTVHIAFASLIVGLGWLYYKVKWIAICTTPMNFIVSNFMYISVEGVGFESETNNW